MSLARANTEELAKTKKSTDYTDNYNDKYKAEVEEKSKEKSKNQMQQYKIEYEKLFHNLLDNGISKVSKKISDRSGNFEYQLKLSNAFKLMELASGSIDSRDLKSMFEPFADDELAAKAFKGLASKIGIDPEKTIGIFHEERDQRTLKNLEDLKKNITTLLNADGPYNPFGGNSLQAREMIVLGIQSYIENKTNDDLEYSVQE